MLWRVLKLSHDEEKLQTKHVRLSSGVIKQDVIQLKGVDLIKLNVTKLKEHTKPILDRQ